MVVSGNPIGTVSNYWVLITHLGTATLILPVAAVHGLALLQDQKRALMRWMIALLAVILVTLLTKLVFLGWGLGIESINFTGVSGHTVLASAFFPFIFYLYAHALTPRMRSSAVAAGVFIAVAVGVSRLEVGAHSLSEVVAGWLLGFSASAAGIVAIQPGPVRLKWVRYSLCLFLLIFDGATVGQLQVHNWEIKLALWMSGHTAAITRQQAWPHPIYSHSQ